MTWPTSFAPGFPLTLCTICGNKFLHVMPPACIPQLLRPAMISTSIRNLPRFSYQPWPNHLQLVSMSPEVLDLDVEEMMTFCNWRFWFDGQRFVETQENQLMLTTLRLCPWGNDQTVLQIPLGEHCSLCWGEGLGDWDLPNCRWIVMDPWVQEVVLLCPQPQVPFLNDHWVATLNFKRFND